MALNPPSPLLVRPLPVIGASLVAVAIFIVVLAVAARLGADRAVVPPPLVDAGPIVATHAGDDAGPGDAGPGDAAVVVLDGGAADDAGVLVTVEPGEDAGPEPDAGPPFVEPAPYDPALVAATAAVVVERCARDALRWDPSLGGPFTLRVLLPAAVSDGGSDGAPPAAAAPRLTVAGLPSPVLALCLERQSAGMDRAPGTLELAAPQAVQARGVLRADGTVETADPVIVAVPPPTTPPDGRRPR